ncbi:alpha/beta hydrolase [Verrucomicrobium sp. BvORR034]|uniref:alpha/beta fold hydrolase n=1 Tax=Verrucomicrobium sp. BvORR034 TaxID=1396418 RepID=UPI0007C73E35|nr:alpha/beta hydrolase [Verrucomicrobium sp. BvORR034]
MIPTLILQTWLLSLMSLGIVGAAAYFGNKWQQACWGWDPGLSVSVFAPNWGFNEQTALLFAAVLMFILTLWGGGFIGAVLRVIRPAKGNAANDPRNAPKPTARHHLKRPDGSHLYVEVHGAADGIPLVLTHGWGLNSAEWNDLKRDLGDKFRLIVWDEPGLGRSRRPSNRDYSIEKLAHDLHAVVELAGRGKTPVVLVGHSIGGMINLTFCRLYPNSLGTKVMGIVLTHTTPTNPVRTTSGAALYTALETPVLRPLMYLTIAVSPLLWIFNWMSYRNGLAHLSVMRGSFAGTETWEQVDFAASFQTQASPAVVARGMLGMMSYDALSTLPAIAIPTLIVAADKDSTTLPEASKVMEANIPSARMITLSPAKHLGLIEHHQTFADAVSEFAYMCRAKCSVRFEKQ